MQRHKKLSARILSMALSVAMVATMMPATVFAAEGDVPLGASALGASSIGTIRSFDKLEDRFEPSTGEGASKDVYALNVELNTPFEDLNLPDELTGVVARTTTVSTPSDAEDTATDDTVSGNQPATPSDAEEEVKEEIKDEDVPLAPEGSDKETTVTTVESESVPVEWNSDKEYKSDENGKFVYTAVLPEGYNLADGVKLPQIYVMVGTQARAGGITQRTTSLDIDGSTVSDDKLAAEGWKWDSDTSTLTLNGADFNVASGSPIVLRIPATVVLEGTNTITATVSGEALYGTGAVTIDMATGSTTTFSSIENGILVDSLMVQGDGELTAITSSSDSNSAITSSNNSIIKGKSVVHAEATVAGNATAFDFKDLTIAESAVFTAKGNSIYSGVGPMKGTFTATGKAITCNIGSATGYTSPAYCIPNFFYEDASGTTKANDIKIATGSAVAFSTLTANGTANTTDTTELTLTFDKDVTGLTADDITVTGATKGTLTKVAGQTGQYTLAISAITVAEGANVTVAVAKTGFTFNPANLDVAVHKEAATGITVTINGTEYKGSTLQDAITKSGVAATAVTELKITAGTVTEADWNYLKNLTAMTSFEIAGTIGNDKVANIPNGIFTDAEIVPIFPQSIVTVTVPQKITIGEVAFGECSALTSVSFPAATSIGELAFYGCSALTSVSFPTATSIGKQVFIKCTALTSVSFPAATTIGKSAFNGCRALTSVSFPEATSIGEYAFDNCANLTSTNFPKTTTIDEDAFRSNVALTNASLPKVETISARAFYGCSALATLKLPATPPTVDNANVFGACPATRALGYVDASGTALTGDDLTTAQAAYKAFDDGNTTDNLWYGWTIVPAATNTGGGGSSSGQTIYTSVPPKYTGGTKIIGNVRVPDYTVEGAWKKNANGTWNFYGNGGQAYANIWAPVFNPYADVTKGQSAFDWFKFDANGIMITGWHTDTDGNTYYLNPTSDNTLGAMQTGWVLINGKYYYFNEMLDGTRGKLFQNTRTPDGYLVDENGVWDGSEKQ